MQGAELLRDPDFAKTLERSPFQARDLPGLSSAVADTFDQMPNEVRQQLTQTLAELSELSDEELLSYLRLVIAVEKDPSQYPKLVESLVRSGAVEPGEMPEEYDPTLMGIVKAIIGQALLRVRGQTPKFAKGGIVSLKESAKRLQAEGRDGDTILAHLTPREAEMLKEMGGSGGINPTTGLPEFKIMRTLRTVFKVGAQILGTAALTFLGVPPPIAGAIVGGVSTLLSGGSAKDALKSALFSGLTAGITSGISSSFSGGDFMSGFMGTGASSSGGSISERISGLFGGTSAGSGAASVAGEAGVPLSEAPAYNPLTQGRAAAEAAGQVPVSASAEAVKPGITPPGGISSFFNSPSLAKAGEFVSNNKVPLLLAGGAALIAADRNSAKKQAPSIIPSETGTSLLAKYPEKYGVNPESLVPRTIQFGPSTVFPNNRYVGGYSSEFPAVTRYAKAGGHISGPGTGTSDSIPARLSDGEFVMTAKAVLGAGDGDRMKGARKMYELMHKFERMA